MNLKLIKTYTKSILPIIFLFTLSTLSHAAGMSSQGASVARSVMNWLYLLLGIGSTIYLLYILIMIKMQYKGWNDLFMGFVLVVVAGAILLLGDFLFVYGGSGAS